MSISLFASFRIYDRCLLDISFYDENKNMLHGNVSKNTHRDQCIKVRCRLQVPEVLTLMRPPSPFRLIATNSLKALKVCFSLLIGCQSVGGMRQKRTGWNGNTYSNTHIHTYTHVHTYTHTHIYTHTHSHAQKSHAENCLIPQGWSAWLERVLAS